jgi:hypothetical protein
MKLLVLRGKQRCLTVDSRHFLCEEIDKKVTDPIYGAMINYSV